MIIAENLRTWLVILYCVNIPNVEMYFPEFSFMYGISSGLATG